MFPFLNNNVLTALGWSLLNGIWQMGILWLVYLLLTRNHKRFSAAANHDLAVLFSGLGVIWFLYSLSGELIYPGGFAGWEPLGYFFSKIPFVTSSLLSALTVVYLAILTFRSIRYMFGFYQMRAKRYGSESSFSGPLQLFSNRISAAMGIGKHIGILLVDWADTAQTIGFFKPLILLPVALVNRLTMQQVETILLHELLHIRRQDYLVNILMTLFRTIFFFNPFARFFFRTVAEEREHACDDGVLRWGYPAHVYAEALFTLEKLRQLPHSLFLAANGNNPRLLMERIRRVVGEPASCKNPFSPLLSFSMIAALFIFTVNSFSRFPRPDAGIQPHVRMAAVTITSYVYATGPETTINGSKRVERINGSAKSLRVPAPVMRKAKYKQFPVMVNDPAIMVMQDAEKAAHQIRFAEHYILRNYSNQKASEPAPPSIADFPGSPYVPSASFSFQPAEDTLQPDVLLQNKWKAFVDMERIKTIEVQVKLKGEIAGKIKELKQLEEENRKLIGQKQKDLEPILLKIKENMQRRKEEIHRLRVQLQIQDGEIIFI